MFEQMTWTLGQTDQRRRLRVLRRPAGSTVYRGPTATPTALLSRQIRSRRGRWLRDVVDPADGFCAAVVFMMSGQRKEKKSEPPCSPR